MIKRLPKDVIDRIAAGEVIERPASVVKELIENALDAGATNVRIELEGGGRRAIRVRDDGLGMGVADLELAFAPHATSKLGDVDDLLSIGSYGFRGEALASIGAISRARIVSRARGAEEGFEIRCEGGVMSEIRPAGAPVGTLVEAQQLFFNVPARSRFLKGDAAEGARCVEVVARFAMVAQGVGFVLTVDGRSVLEIAPQAGAKERAATLMGDDAARGLLSVMGRVGEIAVEALIVSPDQARSTSLHQYVFLNGRLVKDNTVKAAAKQAYREFLAPALQPSYVLKITMDPGEVDVNVHPAKSEVRFRDSNAVFRAVHGVVLDGLRKGDLAARPTRGAWGSGAANAVCESATEATPTVPSPAESPTLPAVTRSGQGIAAAARGVSPPIARANVLPGFEPPGVTAQREVGAEPMRAAPAPTVPPRTGRGFLRIFQTYIVYESGQAFAMVDQHALHERVIYEQLRLAVEGRAIPTQQLVAPMPVEVGRAGVVAAQGRLEEFAKVGLEVTVMSPTTLAIHSLPPLLKSGDLKEMVEAILESGGDGADASARAGRAPLLDRLHTVACRAAVKAGDALTDHEAEALLASAERLPEAKACPHGRPTVVRIERADIERWFRRRGF